VLNRGRKKWEKKNNLSPGRHLIIIITVITKLRTELHYSRPSYRAQQQQRVLFTRIFAASQALLFEHNLKS
jgi:hypothetical protein